LEKHQSFGLLLQLSLYVESTWLETAWEDRYKKFVDLLRKDSQINYNMEPIDQEIEYYIKTYDEILEVNYV